MKKNILSLFLDKLMAFPLWVKQIIFLRLHQNLSSVLSEDFIFIDEKHVFHLYLPVLTFLGKTELEEKKSGLDDNIYNFLQSVDEGFNMLEISLNNFWTIEEIAKYFIFCLEQDYVKPPESEIVMATAGFMAGKYRTGEYFKRSGKIDVNQLEKAILTQKKLRAEGNNAKIAEIMISLNLVTEKDTKSLLAIKEESKKRFILNSSMIPEQIPIDSVSKNEQEEIARLTEQNKQLKEKLIKLLDFVKQNLKK